MGRDSNIPNSEILRIDSHNEIINEECSIGLVFYHTHLSILIGTKMQQKSQILYHQTLSYLSS